jgi:hypothetical protein
MGLWKLLESERGLLKEGIADIVAENPFVAFINIAFEVCCCSPAVEMGLWKLLESERGLLDEGIADKVAGNAVFALLNIVFEV